MAGRLSQDVEAVKSVQGQLEAFKSNMARDSKAQRSECRQLVSGAIKRAQMLVDSTLQVTAWYPRVSPLSCG